jgi:hypothetical protein
VIPWFNQTFERDGKSVCHDRWIAVRNRYGKVAYAQWSDCGPFRTDHWQYVFGNERPKPNLNQGAAPRTSRTGSLWNSARFLLARGPAGAKTTPLSNSGAAAANALCRSVGPQTDPPSSPGKRPFAPGNQGPLSLREPSEVSPDVLFSRRRP